MAAVPAEEEIVGVPAEQETVGVPRKPEEPIKPKEQAWEAPTPEQDGEAAQPESTNDPPKEPFKGSFRTCCSLKNTPLLGDQSPEEDSKFGQKTEGSYMDIVRSQLCHVSVQLSLQVVYSLPFLVLMIVMMSLPPNGFPDATAFTIAAGGCLTYSMNVICGVSPLVWSQHKHWFRLILWSQFILMPFASINVYNKLVLWNAGNSKSTSHTQVTMVPAAVFMAVALGKINTCPGWLPQWSTFCCFCSGYSKAAGTCVMYFFCGFLAALILGNYVYYDNVTFSQDTSLTMSIVRPIMFFTVKKLVYSIFSIMGRMRHPMLTKCSMTAVSSILGFSSAIAFTKTRSWTGMGFFILTGWLAHGARMWVFLGAPMATWKGCFVLEWFRYTMVAGKPIISSTKMQLRQLRAFENMAQSWGTTYGMTLFVVFYPIANLGFGPNSMPFRFFFPTDLSVVFLVLALVNEIVMDVHTQVTSIHATKCDFTYLFASKPTPALTFGLLFQAGMVANLMNTMWAWELQRITGVKAE